MDIALLLALILLNGIFAMSEIALVTSRRAKLAKMAASGDKAAVAAVKLGDDPTSFLSTVQIGITSIGILNGIVGEAALAGPLAHWLQDLGVTPRSSQIGATVIVVVSITYISIVIGELVPKRIGQMQPEKIARLVARPMRLLSTISRPFVYLLAGSTSLILRALGQKESGGSRVTEEEIQALLTEGSESGVIEKNEHDMVRNVFRLDDRLSSSLMVPRTDIIWLDANLPLDSHLSRLTDSPHTYFPVCQGGLDNVLGIASAKHLLAHALRGDTSDWATQIQPAAYVPESQTGLELLNQFRASGTHLALVVDEYGDIQGLVTLNDVIESVTGQFATSDPTDAWAVQRADGSWLLDGLLSTVDLKDHLQLRHLPDETKGRYHTLSGLMMWLLGRLPNTGDIAEWEDWRLEVVDLDGKRIDKVLASRKTATTTESTPTQFTPE